ncbi:MAG: hypothetical protein WCR30_03235 [Clostridia bacterium]
MKINFKIKKIIKIFLCVMLALPMLFLSACQGNEGGTGDGDGGGELDFKTWEYVEGFRAAIRPSNPGEAAFSTNTNETLFEKLSRGLLEWLTATYGSGGTTMNYDGVTSESISPNSSLFSTDERNYLNYDSIRYSPYLDNNTIEVEGEFATIIKGLFNSNWNWTFNNNKSNQNLVQSFLASINKSSSYYYKIIDPSEDLNTTIGTYYNDIISTTDYQSLFYNLYGKPFEINILETILGITPTTFTPVYYAKNTQTGIVDYSTEVEIQNGTETWMKMQVDGEEQTEAIDPSDYNIEESTDAVSQRLEEVKAQYIKTASYIGIQWDEDENFDGSGEANSDGGRLVQFILSSVIGMDLVQDDDEIISPDNTDPDNENYGKRYYRKTITYIVKELLKSFEVKTAEDVITANEQAGGLKTYNIGDIAGSFFPVAGIEYLDYRLNDFIVPENGDNDFVNSPSQEYQSLAIIPKQRMIFQSASLHFQSLNHDLSVNVKMRWFNNDSSEAVIQNVGVVNINQGEYNWETNDNSILAEPPSETQWCDVFNSSLLSYPATEDEFGTLDRQTNSKYYKTIASSNGFGTVGVTNEEACDFSFFEFVFDVVKSPNDPVNTAYDFQVKMFIFAISA